MVNVDKFVEMMEAEGVSLFSWCRNKICATEIFA